MQVIKRPEGEAHDEGKVRLDLVPPSLTLAAGRALTHGLLEYEENNWRKGLLLSQLYASLQRHLLAFWSGEDLDPKSLLPHLDHAAARLAMLIELYEVYPELDNRPAIKPGELVQ